MRPQPLVMPKATELAHSFTFAGQGGIQGCDPQESSGESQVRYHGQGSSSGAVRQEEEEALASAAAQTRDAEHGSLKYVRGIVSSALDICVGHRDHLERRREACT